MTEQSRYAKLIRILHQDREKALETAAKLFEGDMKESLGELSVIDNHPADIGSELYQRSWDVAQHDGLLHRVDAIDAALELYDQGEYGRCEHCGQAIPFERLEALPYTTVCTECSRKEEKEGELLNPPFARTFNDGTDSVGFDGEDSWQAVARYGTSDSFQDLGTNRDIADPNDMYENADEPL